MVATSQNGYFANNRNLVTSINIPGGRISCRKDYGIPIIVEELATRFHNEVEKLVWPGNWGYAERNIRGSSQVSNHASATAWDFNAPKHPLGKSGTFNATQVKAIKKILSDFDGVIRWGGNYSGRKDEMHFEIVKNEAACEALAKKISGKGVSKPKPSKPSTPAKPSKPKEKPKASAKAPTFPYGELHYIGRESNSKFSHSGVLAKDKPNVRQWQEQMRYRGWTISVDGVFGEKSETVARQFQRQIKVTVDGKVGKTTWGKSWTATVT